MPKSKDVDAYIAAAQPFAKPILKHLRGLIHKTCPGTTEVMKWSFPHFQCDGPLCSIAAFKGHAVMGFAKASLLQGAEKVLQVKDRDAMGHLGRLTSVKDLPSDRALAALLREVLRLNRAGVKAKRPARASKAPVKVPEWFMKELRKRPKALATFEAWAPSHRREYVEWLLDAKQEATRERRMATALEWIGEGKHRNWKYEAC